DGIRDFHVTGVQTCALPISFNYSLRYGYGEFDRERLEYKGKLTHNFGLSGSLQPTKNWNFTFNTDYNFDFKKFTNINCTLTRNRSEERRVGKGCRTGRSTYG